MKKTWKFLLTGFLIYSFSFSAIAESKLGPKLLQKLTISSSNLSSVENANQIQDNTFPVIVEFNSKVNLQQLQGNKQERRRNLLRDVKAQHAHSRRSIARLLRQYGVTRQDSLWLINSLSFDAPRGLIIDLIAEPTVRQIRLDYQIMAPGTASTLTSPAEWNLTRIGAPNLWGLGITGLGIVVANMDTGVDINHSELAATWRGGSNSWYDPHCQPFPGDDPELFIPAASCPDPASIDLSIPRDSAAAATGHGSQTMGIMVGGDAGGTAVGVAPDAKWIATKIFNDNGAATVTSIHKAFSWFLDPDNDPFTDDAPDVINASWVLGGTDVNNCVLIFQSDIQMLKAVDIAIVFAAGNEGGTTGNPSTSTSPGNNPEGYAVGAIDSNDFAASFSSRGPGPVGTVCEAGFFPKLMAPGVSVKTTSKNSIPSIDSYATVGGTSFAAPHVVGAMALLLDALPNLNVSELESVLLNTAQSTLSSDDALGPDDIYGHGVLNVEDAYYTLCPASGLDNDGDGIPDVCDNCTLKANSEQVDTDRDGYGNICDFDLNNDNNTDFLDLGLFSSVFFTSDADADFNADGIVDYLDLGLFSSGFFQPPGPSSLVEP